MRPATALRTYREDPKLVREQARLDALDRLDILDTPQEARFDRITRLVRDLFDVDIALVSVIDAHRQWYKACDGVEATEIPRRETFCQHVVANAEPLVIEDTLLDARFATHPHVTGGLLVRFYAGVPLVTADGHAVGTVCAIGKAPRRFGAADLAILSQIAAIATDLLELRDLVRIDALTAALSRSAFRQEGTRVVDLALRHRDDLCCLAIDIDHFKKVNDRWGHAVGDTVLARFADICRDALRRTDLFGRIGGEEFAAILPHTSRRAGEGVAEKLRAAVDAARMEVGGEIIGITTSVGLAAIELGCDFETLLGRADSALYLAKGEGRNRCVSWRAVDGTLATQQRRKVLKAGQIVFNGRMSTIDCTIRSLSDDSAGIDVSADNGIPERFTLAIRMDRIERDCRVVARTPKHLEVEFL